MFVSRLIKHAALAAAGLMLVAGAGSVSAQAMPLQPLSATIERPVSTAAEIVQYRPGAARTFQYRRAMRHYRNRPGARSELRRNRTVFCRNQPSRC